MSTASGLHRRGLAFTRRIGVAVTYTRIEQIKDPATGALTPTVTTITGSSSPDSEDQTQRYQALGLIGQRAATHNFWPDIIGQKPELNDTVVRAGETWRVRDVAPFDLGGDAITCKVVEVI